MADDKQCTFGHWQLTNTVNRCCCFCSNMKYTVLMGLLCLYVGVARGEIEQHHAKQSLPDTDDKLEFVSNCHKSYGLSCFKLDCVNFLDNLSKREDVAILPGVSLVQQNNSAEPPIAEVVGNLARAFPNDVDRRLDAYLVHKVNSYLNNHAISIRLFDPKAAEAARSIDEPTGDESAAETGN